jgi:flagellar P-ring protein precursor FlgI
MIKALILSSAFVFGSIFSLQALTVKDLVQIQGEQENELSGQGLVVGLTGTGDKKNPLKDAMLRAWFHNSGLEVPAADFESKNVALVNVSGRISAHAGKGQRIPLTVSTVGDAKSLKGGILLYTKLHYPGAATHKQPIFATAEGALQMTDGQPETVANVEGIIATPVPSNIIKNGRMRLLLNKANYVDADRISRQINQHFSRMTGHNHTAKAITAGIIDIQIPEKMSTQPISFIAEMKKVPILFTDVASKIIINTRKNLVMLNEKVEVSPFAFAYNDLNVVVGDGPRRNPNIDSRFVQNYEPGDGQKTDLQNLVDGLNAMRVAPKDLVEIIKYAHKIGAIQAELILE